MNSRGIWTDGHPDQGVDRSDSRVSPAPHTGLGLAFVTGANKLLDKGASAVAGNASAVLDGRTQIWFTPTNQQTEPESA